MSGIPTIINSYDQCCAAGGLRIVISYYPAEPRARRSWAKFSVSAFQDGREIATDPQAAWYDYKRMTFSPDYPLREGKPKALAQAIKWANKKYGERQFVKNRMGDWVEKEVNEKFPLRKRNKP